MKNQKNIIITILIILIIGFAGMMCYHVFVVEDKEEVKQEKNKATENMTVKKIDLIKDGENEGEVIVKIDDKDVNIKIKDDFNTEETHLYIAGRKTSIALNRTQSYGEAFIMNDIIIFPVYSSDIYGDSLYIFDDEGTQLKKITEAEGMGILSTDNGPYGTFNFNNNKITFTASRIGHFSQVFYNNIEDAYVCKNPDENSKVNNINKIPADTIVEAKYEIEYLGNKQFSNIKMVSGTEKTLKQAKIEYCK